MKIYHLLLASLTLSFPGYGVTTVVKDGDTLVGTFTIVADGDSLQVEEGGLVTGLAADAVAIGADNQTVINSGTIFMDGTGNFGIVGGAFENITVINNGLLSANTGLGDLGILIGAGSGHLLVNNGSILSDNLAVVSVNWTDGVIINNGQISSDGFDGIQCTSPSNIKIVNSGQVLAGARGIFVDSPTGSTRLTNTGSITVGGSDPGLSLVSAPGDSVVINSGRISAQGAGALGVSVGSSDNVVFTNSGIISSTSAGGFQLGAGSNNHFINSGIIQAPSAPAILIINATDPTLTLLRGSNIQGDVQFLINPLNLLNVETGLNLSLTRTNDAGFNNFGIEAPFILSGLTVGVIDPTGFTLQPDVVADLSDTILDSVYRHRLGCCTPCGSGAWVQGIGSYRKRSHADKHVGYDIFQGGFLIGYDNSICRGYLGLFAGASYVEAEVDHKTQKAHINSYVGGATYETCFCNNFVGLAITAGYIDWDNDRYVMNNLVAGGVETASADIDGFFLSPEITITRKIGSHSCQPVMSFTLRYAGFFPGNYSESGSQTNLSVSDRHINLLTTRLEAALPLSDICGKCCWSVEPYIGVYGRYQLSNGSIDGEFLGQDLSFSQPGPRNVAAFLSGIRGIQSFGCVNLSLNLEASFDSHSSARLLGEGGVNWNF